MLACFSAECQRHDFTYQMKIARSMKTGSGGVPMVSIETSHLAEFGCQIFGP